MPRLSFSLLAAFILILLNFSCQSSSNSGETESSEKNELMAEAAEETNEMDGQPEMTLFAIRVDKLRMRKEAGQKGELVTYMDEGEFVTGMGEVSDFVDTLELRGMYYREPYYKVVSSRPAQETGYIFGGGLQPVYIGPAEGAPDLAKLAALTAFLKSLPASELTSGSQAWEYLRKNFPNETPVVSDAAFILFRNFMEKMEMEGMFYNLVEQVEWQESDYNQIYAGKFNMAKNPITASLARNGFALGIAEGSVFPVADKKAQADFFKNRVTSPMKQYIELDFADFERPAMDDGGITVPLEDFAERAIAWEKFETANPRFLLSGIVHEHAKWMGLTVLGGVDNTPVANYETEEISEEFEKVWNSILAKYPETRLAGHIRDLQGIVKKSGDKYTSEARVYVDRLWEQE